MSSQLSEKHFNLYCQHLILQNEFCQWINTIPASFKESYFSKDSIFFQCLPFPLLNTDDEICTFLRDAKNLKGNCKKGQSYPVQLKILEGHYYNLGKGLNIPCVINTLGLKSTTKHYSISCYQAFLDNPSHFQSTQTFRDFYQTLVNERQLMNGAYSIPSPPMSEASNSSFDVMDQNENIETNSLYDSDLHGGNHPYDQPIDPNYFINFEGGNPMHYQTLTSTFGINLAEIYTSSLLLNI